ncbi:MAG: hypothetical protein JST48_00250 [Bacteroidetes bacterium]|nr:hypothetical protein [Bacteroidota bacterium]
MKAILLSFFILVSACGYSQLVQTLYRDAMDAYKKKNHTDFYQKIKEANKIRPNHQGILYQLGIACALNGKKDEANANLKKAILINTDFKLEGVADFNSIKDTDGFKKLLSLQTEWQTPLIHSKVAFTLKDRALHTEGIEYDAVHQTFYLGSIHKRKIVKVDAQGNVSDFCTSGFSGMASVFGIKVDTKRNVLWACTSPMQEMENYDSAAKPAVFKFELSSGKLIRKYTSYKPGVYGDLIINKSGNVFVSDSQTNEIFTIDEKKNQIVPFFSSNEFISLQGLAFSADEKYLFIADYPNGIFRLNIKSRELIEIKTTLDVSLKGVDGLYAYNHSLIAIQNGVFPSRSARYFLNKNLNEITGFEIIDRKHPDFNEPTLGVIVGKTFYYIANSQWGSYDDKHQIKPHEQLQDIVVLKYELK